MHMSGLDMPNRLVFADLQMSMSPVDAKRTARRLETVAQSVTCNAVALGASAGRVAPGRCARERWRLQSLPCKGCTYPESRKLPRKLRVQKRTNWKQRTR